MLIYSEERVVPTDVNMMVLSTPQGGYLYVHRALYDQAVVIDDIYQDELEVLIEALTGKREARKDVITFMENTPRPISILGPFLLLVKGELENYVDMVGAIHAMSGPINFRKLLKIPFEMRNTPSFSLSIKEEYSIAWDRFFMTTMPFGAEMVAPTNYGPLSGTATQTVNVEPKVEEVVEEVFEESDDDWLKSFQEQVAAATKASNESYYAELNKDGTEEEKKEEQAAPAPAPEAPAPEAPAPKSGLELLRSGGF